MKAECGTPHRTRGLAFQNATSRGARGARGAGRDTTGPWFCVRSRSQDGEMEPAWGSALSAESANVPLSPRPSPPGTRSLSNRYINLKKSQCPEKKIVLRLKRPKRKNSKMQTP